jgi:hypothetical protein
VFHPRHVHSPYLITILVQEVGSNTVIPSPRYTGEFFLTQLDLLSYYDV